MKKEIIAKADVTVSRMDFIRFLDERQALGKYINNLEANNKSLITLTKHTQPPQWTSGCFIWSTTPEGRGFWDKVDEVWKKFLQDGVPEGCTVTYHLQED